MASKAAKAWSISPFALRNSSITACRVKPYPMSLAIADSENVRLGVKVDEGEALDAGCWDNLEGVAVAAAAPAEVEGFSRECEEAVDSPIGWGKK